MQKLLTIVVPVYKVEAYINKCLDSLLVSPDLMEKLEVLIVNDGTPDNSAEMSREYVKRYPGTFYQIDKENGGHGSAWNVGLKQASGKYLRFLDSDDWFTNLDRLMGDLEECDADLVFNPFIREYTYENRSETVEPLPIQGVARIDAGNWGASYWGYNNVNFWNTTYKTEILKPLQPLFAEKTMFDDYIITWVPLVYGRTYISLEYPVYHYLIGRPGQTMSMTQQRKGASSYRKCFEQYETVRSRVIDSRVPQDLMHCIDSSISSYAMYIFSFMVYLPYNEAKDEMKHLWDYYLYDYPYKTHLGRRYERLPFWAFYLVEIIRRRVNNLRCK